jgi:hypothetical protein
MDACALITRNPNGSIDTINDVVANVGGTTTSGVDFAISYDHTFPFGRIRTGLEGTYLNEFNFANLVDPSTPLVAKGNYDFGVYTPLKTNFTTQWARDGISAGFNIRYIAGFDECDGGDCNSLKGEDVTAEERAALTREVDANITADIFAGYTLKSAAGVTTLSVGMNNVLDQDPPLIYTGFAGDSDSSTYDYMGRFVYARLSQQF